jgi:hypothetical protein
MLGDLYTGLPKPLTINSYIFLHLIIVKRTETINATGMQHNIPSPKNVRNSKVANRLVKKRLESLHIIEENIKLLADNWFSVATRSLSMVLYVIK